MSLKKLFISVLILASFNKLIAQSVQLKIDEQTASIENNFVSVSFNLTDGKYNCVDKTTGTTMIQNAWFRLDPGEVAWVNPKHKYSAKELGLVEDEIGLGKKIRVWYKPQNSYDPDRFLDVTVYQGKKMIVFDWGVHNRFEYTVRVRNAEILQQGSLFVDQEMSQPQMLESGAGTTENFVENTWELDGYNGAMLTYLDQNDKKERRTIVGGGLEYSEFGKSFETHKGIIKENRGKGRKQYSGEGSYITLSIWDPLGKRIPAGETWVSVDSYYLDIVTKDPFQSLEKYGEYLALVNNANPNAYNFPTLCGWMVSTKNLGEGKPINTSPGLVDQMKKANESGMLKYAPIAVRLEPDYYCYGDQGNSQQGWWDDEHWQKYKSLLQPYETFSKFSDAVREQGGSVFTYFQVSMPSNDFARSHPDWMMNNDISLLHVDHPHHRPLVRYDYTNTEFQEYMVTMWERLKSEGVVGIKFDYPETGWERNGGFDDASYTTTSAYRKSFQLCRDGMGAEAYIHERNLGETNTPRLDCTVGIVDLQRVWWDASHFEPEMASRIGLRWFKQGKAFRYYPDGKSFYFEGKRLSQIERRSFLTLIGLLSGRLELGTSFGSMTPDMQYDLSRIYPVLPNGQSFRPVDMFMDKKHPEVYTFDVNPDWKQVILTNGSVDSTTTISVPLQGVQVDTGSLGLEKKSNYYVFDFWNQKSLGSISGNDSFMVNLEAKESNVYAFHKVTDHPQIIGTNRHIMCGMMELHHVKWDVSKKNLFFEADLVEGETMRIHIANNGYEIQKIKASDATVKTFKKGNIISVELTTKKSKNNKSKVNISFY